MIRTTIICPEALIADANALASVLGAGPSDAQSFGEAIWVDAEGQYYAIASQISETLSTDLFASLTAPDWPVDLEAAMRAQNAVEIVDGQSGGGDPAALRVLVGMTVGDALARTGLVMGEALPG